MRNSDAAAAAGIAPDQPERPRLRYLQIWNMCFGLFGVQIVWGLQNVNTSRIFQTLGANIDELAILWIAGPATGLLVQPIIGHLSDRTSWRFGRRRPYLLGGAILTALALFGMPNAPTLWMASLMLWLLTASINIAMEPFRALVADRLPEAQRNLGFTTQVFFIGAGAVFASALPWMLNHWFGIDNSAARGMLPHSVRLAFTIGGAGLLFAVGWTVLTTPEARFVRAPEADHHPIPSAEGAAKLVRAGLIWCAAGIAIAVTAALLGGQREVYVVAGIAGLFGLAQLASVALRRGGRTQLGLLEIVEDILHMPDVLRRLALVQFFTWFGLFAMWIYTVPAIAARQYHSSDPASAGYNAAADWVGVLFAGYNGVAALAALLLLSRLAAAVGRRAAHALCLACGAAGLAGFALIRDPALLWLPTAGIGIAWAAILSFPYAMVSSAVLPHKTGVYMGIHNTFLVVPQLVAATLLGPLVGRAFGGDAGLALLLAAAMLALAAGCSLLIPSAADSGTGNHA